MKIVLRKASWIVVLGLALAGAGVWRSYAWWQGAVAPVASTQAAPKVIFTVPAGSSAQEIGERLQQAGLIRSQQAWQLWTRWQSLQNRETGFQAGTYELSPALSLDAIARKIWTGDVVKTTFTIPEGWSLQQMAAYFEERGFFKAQDFLAAAQSVSPQAFPWLPPQLPVLEGFLFPDTYQVAGTTLTPQQVIEQMLDRFQQVALPIYQQQKGSNPLQLNLLQWVTLASIVEKEAVVAAERPLIAGVFSNRLKQGITLGSDPTVEYGLGIQQTKEQPLTLTQVRTPSPYNTYLNPGLPPTPIASPGLASLQATLNPMATDYLYFVARYDGTHIFSRTLAEHESAQNRIRDRVEAELKPRSTPPKRN